MADTRVCEHCGALFEPRREHARFCSARCRVEWNRKDGADRSGEMSALDWSIVAMREATSRLARVTAVDPARAYIAAGEAVWWVTIVDATLVRYHTEAYDCVLEAQPEAERAQIEQTLAGLRFVRNQMTDAVDRVDFISPGNGSCRGEGITSWQWAQVPGPPVDLLPPRSRAWEISRYRAYRAALAGRTLGETFGRAAAFLGLAVTKASALAGADHRR